MSRAQDEPVRLTQIYTRGGDAGETSLGDGSRVSKLDARIVAFGTVDELNAALGAVLAGERSRRAPATARVASRTSSSTSAQTSRFPVRSTGVCGSTSRWSTVSSRTATASTQTSRS